MQKRGLILPALLLSLLLPGGAALAQGTAAGAGAGTPQAAGNGQAAHQRATFRSFGTRAFPKQSAMWFTGNPAERNIAVCWEGPSDPDDRAFVRSAVEESWEANSQARFIGWLDCQPAGQGVRIVVEDSETGPYASGLGKELDGVKDGVHLNFTFRHWGQNCLASGEAGRRTCMKAIAIHEFGHVLGFAHEQNRDDTPNLCAKQVLQQGEQGDTTALTPWDPQSVMNYCYAIYRPDLKLSSWDVYALQQYYGVP